MVDITRIRTAISLIAQGLYDKQTQLEKDPTHYPYSGLLHRISVTRTILWQQTFRWYCI